MLTQLFVVHVHIVHQTGIHSIRRFYYDSYFLQNTRLTKTRKYISPPSSTVIWKECSSEERHFDTRTSYKLSHCITSSINQEFCDKRAKYSSSERPWRSDHLELLGWQTQWCLGATVVDALWCCGLWEELYGLRGEVQKSSLLLYSRDDRHLFHIFPMDFWSNLWVPRLTLLAGHFAWDPGLYTKEQYTGQYCQNGYLWCDVGQESLFNVGML